MRIRAIAHYNCPVTYITYIMTGQPVEETPMASTVPRKRRKALTKQHWAKMQPYIKEYYIKQDLTLEETMQRISSEHEFEATEQMYKKRLKAWGFTKQIKADDKEKVLAKILHGEPVTEDMAAVRIDKVLRYARSRIKCGALSDQYLSKISKRYIAVPCARPANVDVPSVPRSPDYPGRFAQFDVFLRAMQAIIERERGEYFSGYQSAPDTIFCALTRGMALWHRNDFAAARISFAQAANNTMEDLRRPKVSVSRIAYCISSILWGKERAPVFQRFAEFLVKAATEVLGPGCPLTVVLKYIRHEQSIDSQVTIWESALAGYAATEGNLDHWWNMAQRRWQWCWRSGKLDLAGQFCSQALIEARQISRFTAEMEAGALHDLDLIMLQEKS